MSINPVQSFGTESGAQASAANLRPPRPQPAPVTVAILAIPDHAQEQLGSGTFPNSEAQPAQKVAAEPERPEDVVQVQHDNQITDEVIIKYTVQATGRVILQVPSAEVLNVARGISQELRQEDLRQEAKLESKSGAGAVEGVEHGH